MNAYPKTVQCGDRAIDIRLFEAADLKAVAAFTAGLSDHDLLFLSRDVQNPKVIAAWLDAIADSQIETLLAFDGARVVGTTAIVRDTLGWSAHVAEIRLLVAEDMRGHGLGHILLEHCLADAIEAGAEKLVARMTPDQRGAIALFEEAGFRGEAMLRDHVRDRAGKAHDLAILSLDVERIGALHGAFGIGGEG